MASDEFEVTWEVDDGYCGGSRPQNLSIGAEEFDDDADEKELRTLFWDRVESDFEQVAHFVSGDEEEFVAWAKGVIEERKAANAETE